MKKDPYTLTIDFGTQSVRIAIFNTKGHILAIEKETYQPTYFSTQAGYAEQKASFYWEALGRVSRVLVEKNPTLLSSVTSVSMTAFRGPLSS